MNLHSSQAPLISIIIPNLNGLEYLRECLLTVRKQTFRDYEIIVIDNGSTDDSVNLLKNEFPSVMLIELPENSGFSAACNKGIEASSGKYIVTLNNDTEVDPQWLEELYMTARKNKNIGMVASKILLNRETLQIDSVGVLIYPDGMSRQRGHHEIDRSQFDSSKDVLLPSACAALYKKEMLNEIGLFDEEFFAYCEDTDLGLRGRVAGWRAVLAPKAIVYHKYSLTGGQYSIFKALHVERNRLWVAVKNFPWIWLCLVPFYSLFRYANQLYGVLLQKGSTSEFKKIYSTKDIIFTVVRAYVSAINKLPLMIKKRRAIKRKLSNREFVKILASHRINAAELILKD